VSDATAVVVRPLGEAELDDADRIYRLAFGTFLGMPEPEQFGGDSEFVRTRWQANPSAALAATIDGEFVGSNFATGWGSVGFFGPLTVAPPYWDKGVGRHLLDATMDLFASWETQHIGLFTFAQSAKHVGLYQRYGFWPRFLTAIMTRPVDPTANRSPATTMSDVPRKERPGVMRELTELTDAVYPGLDVSSEVDSVLAQKLGDTVLIDDGAGLQAIAVCHIGAGSEAGSNTCYVKFGAVRPGPDARRLFGELVEGCDSLAAARGASVVIAGANAGRDQAWMALADIGFRRDFQGVSMHRPNEPGYSTSDSFVIDDWR
jgi:GNAT superfamily N-acetyltransferase